MTMTDPIADMLTRIRNANVAFHDDVAMPSSKLKEAVAVILQREGYITGFDVVGNTASGQVVVDGRQVTRDGRHGHAKGGRIREGDGALDIKASAVSGNIVVLRGGARGESGPQDAPHHDWPAVG